MRETLFLSALLAAFAAAQDGLCPSGEIVGYGKKKDAIVEISQQIAYSVTAEAFDTLSQKMIDGTPKDYGSYMETVKGRSELLVGAKVKKLDDTTYYVCRSDAALPYLDSLRIYLRNKLKAFDYENCGSAGELYAKTLGWQRIIEHLGQADKALQSEYGKAYAKIEKECHCQAFRLHWKADKENSYSETAFSKLSQRMKIEKSKCKGKGISLSYKEENPGCKKEQGMVYACPYKASLSIASCDGREQAKLESGNLEGAKTKEEYAIADLREKFEAAGFWKKWEQELRKWRPDKCD